MVRTCQAEQALQGHITALVEQRAVAEVGLLAGKLGQGARDLVYILVPTPTQDGIGAVTARGVQPTGSKKGQQKGRVDVQLEFDTEWVAEHASQVVRMLPGGLVLVGLYLFAPETSWTLAVPQLLQTARLVQQQAAAGAGSHSGDYLLMHADSVTGKCSVKQCTPGALTPSSLRPCELKFSALTSQLQAVSCSYQVEASLPVTTSKRTLQTLAADLLTNEGQRIHSAVGVIDGTPISLDLPLAELAGGRPSSQPLAVQLLCAPRCSASKTSGSGGSGTVYGRVRVQGSLQGRAYVGKREPASAAVEALKLDLQNSLTARLDVLLENVDDAEDGGASQHPLLAEAGTAAVALPLPARAFFSTKAGIMVSDYLVEGESQADATKRIQELLSLEVIAVSEQEAATAKGPAGPEAWDPMKILPPANVAQALPAKREGTSDCWGMVFTLAFGAAIAGLAVLLTTMLETTSDALPAQQ